ncbi:NAD(P)-dependent alcohol dehydrogenase [Sandarakinorhabdus sp.]|uniref:NAD(P)-dependent alcohol dehydrogenase n=1 Tax=Sandarakinorhabdus sp. TaxID=1916663 RepID=UPI0035619339
MTTIGYGSLGADKSLVPVIFDREPLRAGEVAIDIAFCGVCHSDIHQCADDWENTVWPCVPGHEIVGTVTEVGDGVPEFSVGQTVGVGCMINSCQTCEPCKAGDEQYCAGPKSSTFTYNGPKKPDGTNSYGGYSDSIVVRKEFVLTIPDGIDPAEAAPILCAGVTTYQPMKHFGLKKGQTLGVAGIGGLGHMAVQIGKAMGATVVAFTTSAGKVAAVLALGADKVVVMDDDAAVEAAAQTLDMMIDTVPYPHDIADYLGFMMPGSTLVVVGNMMQFDAFNPGPMVFNRISLAGSLIGGVGDTQEVLDLCAEHGIRPEIAVIDIADINDAFQRIKDDDVRFRYVIDMASLKAERGEIVRTGTRLEAPTRGEPGSGMKA